MQITRVGSIGRLEVHKGTHMEVTIKGRNVDVSTVIPLTSCCTPLQSTCPYKSVFYHIGNEKFVFVCESTPNCMIDTELLVTPQSFVLDVEGYIRGILSKHM